MAELERLVLQLEARITKYERDMAKARAATERQTKAMEKRFEGLSKRIDGFGRGIARSFGTALGAALGGAALLNGIRNAGALADELGDTANQLNITTSELQALRYAALETGVAEGKLDSALDRLVRTLGDAVSGEQSARDSFNALGVAIFDAEGNARPFADVLQDVAKAILKLKNSTEQTAAATDLFGRTGGRMVPLLGQLSGGLGTLTDKASDAGRVMSEETVAALGEANKSIDRLQTRITIAVGEIVIAIGRLPSALNESVIEMAKAAERNGNFVERFFAPILNAGGQIYEPPSVKELEAKLAEAADLQRQIARMTGQANAALNEGRGGIYRTRTDREGAGSAAKAMQARMEALADLEREIALNDELAASYAVGEAALDGIKAAYDAVTEARRLGLEVGSAEYEQFTAAKAQLEFQRRRLKLLEEGKQLTADLRTEEEQRADTLAQLNQLLKAGAISQETYNRAVEQGSEEFQRQEALVASLEGAGERAFDRIGSAITEAFVQGGAAAVDFKAVALGVLSEILQEMFRIVALNPLKEAFGQFVGGLNLFGSGGTSGGGVNPGVGPGGLGFTHFGGPRASGGPVSAGSAYLVGEKRPELFVPRTDGTIIPQVPSAMPSPPPVIVQVINRVPDTTADTRETSEGGQESVVVTLDRMVADRIGRPGTATSRMLEQLGVRRPLTRR